MAPDEAAPPEAWQRAHRAARALATPLHRFLAIEAASGVLLIAAITIALVWANSAASDSYHALWHTSIGFHVGSVRFEHTLHYWLNEGLMTVFFFVVGLEIRRELHEGELSDARRAALPVVAALGGALVPAGLFAILNFGRAGAGGWAVPMATDIAFAVGVVTLLGARVSHAQRVMLLGLAVIDDLCAIVVIAVFFSGGVSLGGAFVAASGLAGVLLLRGMGARSAVLYIVPGAAIWLGLESAGIHPTLSGVIVGLVTPVRPWFGASGFKETTAAHLDGLESGSMPELLVHLDQIGKARREAVSPAERLIHVLHPWVAFVIMPVFALANAGVDLGGGDLSGDGMWLFVGIVAGLAVGKPLGIAAAALLASRVGLATRSAGLSRSGVVLIGVVGGIGFTMSLFIAQLAFEPGPLLETAKLAILVGSGVAIVAGLALGMLMPVARAEAPVDHTADSPPHG